MMLRRKPLEMFTVRADSKMFIVKSTSGKRTGFRVQSSEQLITALSTAKLVGQAVFPLLPHI